MGNPTLQNSTLPAGVWVNLYTEISVSKGSTVAVGTPLGVEHISGYDIRLNVSAASPAAGSGYTGLRQGEYAENEPGDPGFWALSPFIDATINLREV